MSSLRILHVVPYYEQAWAYGGIPRLATTMTRALARHGHRVTVCTTDACDATARATSVVRGDPSPFDVDVRTFPNISNRLAYHWQIFSPRGLATYLRSALAPGRPSFDVAHLHACHNVLTAMAARALTRRGVPYVVSPNGTAKPIERRILAKRLFAATAGRHVLRDAARVLAVTEAERRQLLELGIHDARIATVANPIDVAELTRPADPERFRAAHRLRDIPMVMFLGKLTPRKSVEVLVRAFAQLSQTDSVLVVAGNDMGSGAAIDALVKDLPPSRRVIRTGLLRGRDRLDALAAADVVVYPSHDEIFGLVPIEALMCGTPVVVCDDSGCGETVSRVGGGRIVPHGSACALAEAIESILGARTRWRAHARSAAVRAQTLFGDDVICGGLAQIYADAIRHSELPERQSV
jgi:glycosyltransferase involved in cell wall biosynthesis